MKKNNLRLYQTFINQNNHLSIVYNITHNAIHILNYNGSIYSVTKEGNASYTDSEVSAREFFDNFPKHVLYPEHKDTYQSIKNNFNIVVKNYHLLNSSFIDDADVIITLYEPTNKKLLLIL